MIGVFDSGIGGVTVLRELLKVLPNEDYLYYSDSKYNPYGDKSEDDLKERVVEVVKYLIESKCKIIVIACNTASTISEFLRQKFKVLIVAIEPAYKMVYDNDFTKRTLVMATKATINSVKFKTLYDKYNNHKTTLLACSGLANLIEAGDMKKIDDYLKQKLKPFKDIQCVVLGCTHYPLIKERIRNILGDVTFYDGSGGVSRQTKRLLIEYNLINRRGSGKVSFVDSCNSQIKEKRFFSLLYDLNF